MKGLETVADSDRKACVEKNFWLGKRVFVTGHTGFKGSWLCLWLHYLGAEVTGYSLAPPTVPSLFEICRVDELVNSFISDIRDFRSLHEALLSSRAEIVIHMAAQPIVRVSYRQPADTFSTNVMGVVNLLEAVRFTPGIRAVVNVTSDKCYENKEWCWGYRENEPLGGYDPYSASKACAELVTSSYRNSYFHPREYKTHGIGVASARAGNVIGGGDWAADRLVPDCVRSLAAGEKIIVRNPSSIRPWQHVLEPLNGYLLLCQKLCENGPEYASAWNFGPHEGDVKPVLWVVQTLCRKWGGVSPLEIDKGFQPHEGHCLKLDSSKARTELHWSPKWNLEEAIEMVVSWTRDFKNRRHMREASLMQIEEYSRLSPTPSMQ
jgi:CDP-glucose 4,6-dehydratase